MAPAAPGRGWSLVLAGVLLLLATATARMWLLSGEELELAAATGEDVEARARHLRRAMAHYFPGNPRVARACHELLTLASRQEQAGERAAAARTWQELRSAILALRGVGQPFAEELEQANTRLAELNVGGTTLARLQNPASDPSPGWAALAILGFLLWVGGAVALMLRGLKPDLKLVPARFWPLLLVVLVGWGLFAVGLALA